MPFNSQTDSSTLISKEHKRMLKVVAKHKGQFMRKIIEKYIEVEYAKITKQSTTDPTAYFSRSLCLPYDHTPRFNRGGAKVMDETEAEANHLDYEEQEREDNVMGEFEDEREQPENLL